MTAAKRIVIKCPECGSVNVRAGKENDNTMKCTCRNCGLRFEFDVKTEKVVNAEISPTSHEDH
jgi:transcription elongation factor Elf1